MFYLGKLFRRCLTCKMKGNQKKIPNAYKLTPGLVSNESNVLYH
uniref:Uncharacterized protein n=1 Tax=Anguilla anguilla TaxID=7936 RepID=A0A0E9XTH0_ANGAN